MDNVMNNVELKNYDYAVAKQDRKLSRNSIRFRNESFSKYRYFKIC